MTIDEKLAENLKKQLDTLADSLGPMAGAESWAAVRNASDAARTRLKLESEEKLLRQERDAIQAAAYREAMAADKADHESSIAVRERDLASIEKYRAENLEQSKRHTEQFVAAVREGFAAIAAAIRELKAP